MWKLGIYSSLIIYNGLWATIKFKGEGSSQLECLSDREGHDCHLAEKFLRKGLFPKKIL